MLIYKKRFPLGKGLPFSRYIQGLNEIHFPHYSLILEKIPATENYHLKIVFIFPVFQMGVFAFPGGMLINDCMIQYSNDEKEFTLLGSVGTSNLILALFFIMPAFFLFSFVLFWAFTKGMSLADFIVSVVIAIVTLVPLTSTFSREKNLLERIGSLGSEINKE